MSSKSRVHKNHYFIGTLFNDDEQVSALKNIQKDIKTKYRLKDSHYTHNIGTKYLYLGYITKETALLYMDKIITHLLSSLQEKIHSLTCQYGELKITKDAPFFRVSLTFDDEQNVLSRIVLPYLFKNGILPIYPWKIKNKFIGEVDLLYFKKTPETPAEMSLKIPIPQEKFKIDHISLIRGTPRVAKIGKASSHNEMSLDEIQRYKIDLKDE